MARKLTDQDVVRLRALADEGWYRDDLASEFGVSVQHVGRILRGTQRAQIAGLDAEAARSSVATAVGRYLDDLHLDSNTAILGELALTLAEKLDDCRASQAAAAATAAPGLARQLVDVLDGLSGRHREPDRLDALIRNREARRLALISGAAA